ncbi:transcriptional regulator [Niabella ginsenosidivorans]|uniref:Transcriptional regulator n=1 Tax=Niabella ginsenosidivorans TaxID=1176587 RepID=A0A1A9HYY4_9BACT|nr:DeoR/GlpR family DNA-binding transcription regulator [Niabella ginsenosidivorans]ANH80295.1 transcriptional regulator [Niabella ginsenosidivorans]
MATRTITERHEYILNKINKKGKLSIDDLASEMKVSGVTIRKDLKMLEEKNLLFRTKGGASITNPYAGDKSINEKEFINIDEKKRIAKAALGLIKNADSIMIGSGTTAFTLSTVLHPQNKITVITPALKVGLELSNRNNVEVLQLGGIIRPNSSSVAGGYALHTLDDISCELLFLGVDGIDLDHGATISNLTEATLNRKMIDTAQTLILLADSSKFNRRGVAKICSIEQVNYIVTDDKIPAHLVNQFEDKGIKMIIS